MGPEVAAPWGREGSETRGPLPKSARRTLAVATVTAAMAAQRLPVSRCVVVLRIREHDGGAKTRDIRLLPATLTDRCVDLGARRGYPEALTASTGVSSRASRRGSQFRAPKSSVDTRREERCVKVLADQLFRDNGLAGLTFDDAGLSARFAPRCVWSVG